MFELPSEPMVDNLEDDKWTATIKRFSKAGRLSSHQCTVYNTDSVPKTKGQRCGCQRPIRHHSFDGEAFNEELDPNQWSVQQHTKKLERLIYHSTPSWKFLRCSCESKDDIATLYELMRNVCDTPKLIISVYGGRMHVTMSEDIEKEFMDSLAEVALTPGTWVITSGLNNGATKLIGQGISRLRALTDTKQPTTLLGISWWGNITKKTRRTVSHLGAEDLPPSPDWFSTIPLFSFDDKDSHSLERNHTHFLLLDDGKYRSQYLKQDTEHLSAPVLFDRLVSCEEEPQLEKEIPHSINERELSKQQQAAFAQAIQYPTEMQRSDFVNYICEVDNSYAVTIIVQGGINTCLAVLNEIQIKRPVIFVQGSGKIADVIASLMELTATNAYTPPRLPEREEIEHNLRRFPMRARTQKKHEELIDQIKKIMHPSVRRYLNIFSIHGQLNMKQSIFHAIFKAHFAQLEPCKINLRSASSTDSTYKASQKVNLLEWAIKWNCFDQATDLLTEVQYMIKRPLLAKLFKQALDEDRPAFVDYFLRVNYDPRRTWELVKERPAILPQHSEVTVTFESDNLFDPRTLTQKDIIDEFQSQIQLSERGLDLLFDLYKNPFDWNAQNFVLRRELPFVQPQSEDELDMQYSTWVGSFIWPIFSDAPPSLTMPASAFFALFHRLEKYLYCYKYTPSSGNRRESNRTYSTVKKIIQTSPIVPIPRGTEEKIRDGTMAEELIQAMLRDLLYWSIFTDRMDMAKVLLLHIRTRICGALSCAAILRQRAKMVTSNDRHNFYEQQAKYFERYAVDCINICYSKNERKACELMIREQPLFGKITCMQVAISSQCKFFINTDCFSQALNRIWYNKLSCTGNTMFWIFNFIVSFFTFGLLAPCAMSYCPAEIVDKNKAVQKKHESKSTDAAAGNCKTFLSCQLSNAGVNYYTRYQDSSDQTWQTYVEKVKDFHQCPMIKMCYHFIGYIWLLLVYSYMVLFKLTPLTNAVHQYHWTEIYTIVTILTTLIEYIRRTIFYHITYMREGQQRLLILRLLTSILRSAPYSLFVLGMCLWYGSRHVPSLFTTARIILALDLELWYLWSLKFITVIEILSPKVFMIRNMLRDLMGFLYVALICIAAYGVVSRTMISQGTMEFTVHSISTNIFHAPYWLLYADSEDERRAIDSLTTNSNNGSLAVEAAVTHVLLAFHMILFNILLLNLLIAAFAVTISKVETNSKYFYHRQRYAMTQEYFEKPILPVPPFIVLCYLGIITRYTWHGLKQCCRQDLREKTDHPIIGIFKMIPTDPEFTERCTAFEHAATYDYARCAVEAKKD